MESARITAACAACTRQAACCRGGESAVPSPDLDVERRREGRPREVRRIEQTAPAVDTCARSGGRRRGRQQRPDHERRRAGPPRTEEHRRPRRVQPQLRPPERECAPTPRVGRAVDALCGVRELRVQHRPPGRMHGRAASSSACVASGTSRPRRGASRRHRRRPPARLPRRIETWARHNPTAGRREDVVRIGRPCLYCRRG